MWGINTTCVEIFDQVLPGVLSKELAHICQNHMEEKGITVHLQEKVVEVKGNGKVEKIITDKREIEADLLIVSAGVIPNTQIAKDAGLDVSPRGTILVNKRMQTSDPCIYAGGDCVQVEHLVSEQPTVRAGLSAAIWPESAKLFREWLVHLWSVPLTWPLAEQG